MIDGTGRDEAGRANGNPRRVSHDKRPPSFGLFTDELRVSSSPRPLSWTFIRLILQKPRRPSVSNTHR